MISVTICTVTSVQGCPQNLMMPFARVLKKREYLDSAYIVELALMESPK